MTYFKKTIVLVLVLAFSLSCTKKTDSSNASDDKNASKGPKNIILLIGDGMGLSQVSSSFYFGDKKSNFERFKHIGLIKTSASNSLITDSAAGATAYSAGVKTYNGAIGVDKDTLSVKLVPEICSPAGISVGLVSTSSITHATPASFYAHVKSRGMQEEIAAQLSTSSVDFFAGGGKDFFYKRKDSINYSSILSEQGFHMDTIALTQPTEFGLDKKFGFLLADSGMPKMIENRGDFLPRATQMALDYLSQDEDGFFLMVEGSQIDWGGHDNKADYLVGEVLDFNVAIGKALDFAEKDGNTLVIVTADHETGGYALSSTNGNYNEITGTFSTGGHTATLIPVFAFGPGSEEFIGVYENNEIFHKMISQSRW